MSNQVYSNSITTYAPPPLVNVFTMATNTIAGACGTTFANGGARLRFDRCNNLAGVTVGTVVDFYNAQHLATQPDYRCYYNTSLDDRSKGLEIAIHKSGTYVLNMSVCFLAIGSDTNVFYGIGFQPYTKNPNSIILEPIGFSGADYTQPSVEGGGGWSMTSNIVVYLEAGTRFSPVTYTVADRTVAGGILSYQKTQFSIQKLNTA